MTRNSALVLFFVLSYAITWILSFVVTAASLPVPVAIQNVSALLLHYGPSLAAVVVVSAFGGASALRQLLAGVTRWRAPFRWYAFAFLFPLCLHLVVVSIDVLLGGTWPTFFNGTAQTGVSPLLLLPVVFVAVFLQAGVAEEIGWRGFALPRLQTRAGPVVASVILGLLWGLWHLHPQNWAALAPIAPWYLLLTVALSLVMTWMWNATGGNLLLAMFFHTASNVSDWIVPTVPGITGASGLTPLIVQVVILWIVAIVVTVTASQPGVPFRRIHFSVADRHRTPV